MLDNRQPILPKQNIMYRSLQTLGAAVLALLVLFTGCDVNDEATNNKAQITVLLTDAPGDFESVFIDIQEVQINANAPGEDDNSDNEDGEENDEGWITLNDDPVRADLLELRNGDTIQLGGNALDAGNYNQIRLILGNDNEIIKDGQSFPLQTPSAQQSGLKLNIDANIEAGETYNLLVDFDAGRSIVETGNGMFILKPVLRAVMLEETGTIAGTVQPADFQTSVLAMANDEMVASTTTGPNGGFSIIGLTQGTYDVTFNPNSDAFTDTTITNVEIEIDEDVDLGTITPNEQ